MNPMQADTVADAFATAATRWPDRPFLCVLPETARAYGIPLHNKVVATGTTLPSSSSKYPPGSAAGAPLVPEPAGDGGRSAPRPSRDAIELTYAGAAIRVQAIREALQAAGAVRGMRLMLLLENRPDFFLYWLAANGLGLSVVPINPDLRAAELEHMANLTRPALIIAIESRHANLRAAIPGVPVHAPGEAIAPLTSGPVFDDIPGRAHEAAVLFTSGSTGKPKGCVLANEYFLRAGQWYAQEGGLCALSTEGERMLTPLPIFHMNAMAYSFMAMIAVGGCLIALDRFHPRSWWQSVKDSGATCLHYLGVMPSILMGLPESPLDRSHSVRFGFGAGVDPKLHGPFEERFGFPLIEAWAMTETGAGAVIAASQTPRLVGESALGQPGPAMEMRIEGEDGNPAEQGELLVRAAGSDPHLGFFREYLLDPAATAEAWEGGWFHTGDIVRRAPDGQIHFVDRKKNVIRRSGENIAAVEVESILARHPAIASVGIAAVPDELRGDEVFALIVPRDEIAPEDLAAWALERMAYYKMPGYVALTDALPLTATNKLQRAELKTRAAALVGQPGTHDLRHLKKRRA
ncbi:AMP-binding protein [Paracoccus alkanivorans]|nr:AMP-binding protein [Paracoccus alkanivorans]